MASPSTEFPCFPSGREHRQEHVYDLMLLHRGKCDELTLKNCDFTTFTVTSDYGKGAGRPSDAEGEAAVSQPGESLADDARLGAER